MPRKVQGRALSIAGNSRPPKRKPAKSRTLDAFAIAQQEDSFKIRGRPHRLGVIVEDRHGKLSVAARDRDVESRSAKRRRINGHESSQDEDGIGGESDEEKWHLGVDDSDDDSDLNSDEAMGESDEERFEGFAFQGSTAPSSKKQLRVQDLTGRNASRELDLREGFQEGANLDDGDLSPDEDELGEGAVDLATALDMNEEYEEAKAQSQWKSSTQTPQSPQTSQTPHVPHGSGYSSGSSEDDTSASEDAQSAISLSDDEDTIENHARLKSFVQGLETDATRHTGSKRLPPPSVMGEPSDYGLASSKKLTVADLLGTVTDPRLRQSLKMLHNSEQKGSRTSTKGIPGKLEPPLPKRQQDRLEREAAYEQSKETLSRWIDTVKQNRRAEHISFPLSNPDALTALGTNQIMSISQSEALTPLESAVQRIMHESGLASVNDPLAEEKVQAFEELQGKKIPIEEVQIRRAELRRARDLMFREELRARRIKKIKSKAYRRVHRKERDKLAQEERAALAAAGAIDSEDERERQDRQRVERRMGARHRESRWARSMKVTGRAVWDEDARLGVNKLARKDDELQHRIEGKDSSLSDGSMNGSSDQESSDDISVDDYDEIEGLKLKEKLAKLKTGDPVSAFDSRLNSMPFMRKAESARRRANEADIDDAQRILARGEGNVEDEGDIVAETAGRRRFGLAQQDHASKAPKAGGKNEFEEPLSENETGYVSPATEEILEPVRDTKRGKLTKVRETKTRQPQERRQGEAVSSSMENPWLSRSRKSRTELTKDAPIISSEALLPESNTRQIISKSPPLTSKTKADPTPTLDAPASASDSENQTQIRPPVRKQQPQRNADLVRMAFAGDDVFQAFAEEKKATIDEEGDKVVDTSLPGWGNWTGPGISKKEQRRANSRKTTKIIKGVDAGKRKDAKLDKVIINEKRSKKVKSDSKSGCDSC
jgi:U3 small nucleolar RNA-associated protein 14